MLILMLAAMAAAEPPAAAPANAAGRDCPLSPPIYIVGRQGRPPSKLGELPPGVPMLAVNKVVDGCAVNVLMRRDANGDRVELPAPTPRSVRALKRQRRLERNR